MRTPTIALVDVGCLFKRTFEANPNAGGENTLSEIIRLEERVDHVVLCLDGPPYKRKEIFPDYKGHRPEPETTEVYQKHWLYKQLKARGYPMAQVKGYEGDDVIATLARVYGESWPEVWLVGADKDLAQCVTDNVLQLVPKHGDRAEYFRGPKEVKERFEVEPHQIPLFLALWGDKGDNVPGVPGIGPVKAAGLIAEHKTLEGIAEHLAVGTGKVWESLRGHWEQLVLSLKLTTLDAHVPLDTKALLTRAAPKVAETMVPNVELVFDGFMGNATPMPEPEPNRDLNEALPKPQPIIGKDPRADEFLRQEHEARLERERNADRAAREQQESERKKERERQPRKEAPEFQSEQPGFPQWGTPGWAPVQGPGPLEAARVKERAAAIDAALGGQPAKVTEAEFVPFGQPQPAAAPPPAAPKPPAERVDRPGLVKTNPDKIIDYGKVDADLQPNDLRSAEVLSKWLDASGMYKQFKNPAAIIAVIMRGKELGLGVTTALAGVHVVEGKPTASADLLRALATRSPKCKYFRLVHSDESYAEWETWHTDHPEPTKYRYTIEEANKAGLRGGNWDKRKRDMLAKTAASKLARIVYPVETLGLYCPEEMGDYVDTVGEAA